MALTPGTRLGTFEIVAPLGAGGMGEVYRPRDTKLDRDVAVKVLPAQLAADADALARFEREAKAVAALSHPNILAIYDFGREPSTGELYAVMELLEGTTLRDRLSDGSLPAKKVIQIGSDIANGLSAAHARGIVHRDLKPENVFITSDGRVKILDFGLARPLAIARDVANAPTGLQHTVPGTVMGTVGYMSPEQVKGQNVDHRSDIFSLGCVLYELATNRRPFQRATTAETMTAVLRDDPPDVPRDPGAAPAGLETVIRHCLEKQPEERFQSARDLAFALQSLSSSTSLGTGGATSVSGSVSSPQVAVAAIQPRARRMPFVPIAIGVGLILAAGAFFAGRLSLGASTGSAATLVFTQLTDDSGIESEPVISPDGQSFAFSSARRGSPDVFVQRIGGRNAILVAGDPARAEGAPAFSPDGASIAFHDSNGTGGIFVTGATGESTRRVTDFGFHPAWSPDGQRLIFCTEAIGVPQSRGSTSALWIVDARGGSPAKLTDGDAVQPVWSPSGKQIAYWAVDTGQRDLFTMPSTGGARVAVTHDAAIDWSPRWSPDGRYLYFSSDRGGAMNLWRIPMDESSGKPAGDPEPITAGVSTADELSLSKDGNRIVFRSPESSNNPASISFDPSAETIGTPKLILDRSGSMVPTGISPDGKWLVLWNILEYQEDVFIARTDGSELRRLTDDQYRDRAGVFSPDGKEIAFYSNRTDSYNVFAIKPDGSGLRALTDRRGGNNQNLLYPTYSPTGDRLVTSQVRSPETLLIDPRQPWTAQKPETLDMRLPDGAWLIPTAWSPDGRRLLGGLTNSSGGSVGLATYDLATKSVRRLTGQSAAAATLSSAWLPDSRRIIFIESDKQNLFLIDADTGRRKDLGSKLELGIGVVIAPDGRTIYATIARQQADIWMATLSGKR